MPIMEVKLDNKDLKIISMLKDDSRMQIREISKKTGITKKGEYAIKVR